MRQPPGSPRARDRLRALVLRYTALLAAVGVVVFMTFGTLRDLYADVRTTDQNQTRALALVHLQVDEESAIRGYERTGVRAFLDPYVAAVAQMNGRINDLLSRFPEGSEEHIALDRFAQRHREWVSVYARPVLRGPLDGGMSRERAGKTLVDGMRGDVSQIVNAQAQRSNLLQSSARRTFMIAEASLLALIIGVAAIGFFSERRAALQEDEYIRKLLIERDTATYLGEWRNKVIGMLAHDFRSALTVIDTAVMLMEDFPHEVDRANTTERIHHEVQSLADMTESALLMARVAADDIPLCKKPVAVIPVLHDIAERYRHNRDIYINGPSTVINGDRSYLTRIFDNLVANAVKYSEADSPITIMVSDRDGGSTTEVAIADRGPGIDPADLTHVFKEYWRAPMSRKNDGNGLGLFIVKKLVDAHGGSIDIRSDPGFGTTIYVRLPAV